MGRGGLWDVPGRWRGGVKGVSGVGGDRGERVTASSMGKNTFLGSRVKHGGHHSLWRSIPASEGSCFPGIEVNADLILDWGSVPWTSHCALSPAGWSFRIYMAGCGWVADAQAEGASGVSLSLARACKGLGVKQGVNLAPQWELTVPLNFTDTFCIWQRVRMHSLLMTMRVTVRVNMFTIRGKHVWQFIRYSRRA